jgi:hypothetical protein
MTNTKTGHEKQELRNSFKIMAHEPLEARALNSETQTDGYYNGA